MTSTSETTTTTTSSVVATVFAEYQKFTAAQKMEFDMLTDRTMKFDSASLSNVGGSTSKAAPAPAPSTDILEVAQAITRSLAAEGTEKKMAETTKLLNAAFPGGCLSTKPDSAQFCQIVRACRAIFAQSGLDDTSRRTALLNTCLLDVSPTLRNTISNLPTTVFGSKFGQVGESFVQQLATALQATTVVTDISATDTLEKFISDLLTVGQATGPTGVDVRLSDIKSRFTDCVIVPDYCTADLEAIKTSEQFVAWFERHSNKLKLKNPPQKKNEQQRRRYPIASTSSSAGTGAPLTINVTIGSRRNRMKTTALIDTGAATSIIDIGMATKHKLQLNKSAIPKLTGATYGSQFHSIGSTVVPVRIGSQFIRMSATVVEGLRYPILIGADALLQAGVIIDSSSGTWSVILPDGSSVPATSSSMGDSPIAAAVQTVSAIEVLLANGSILDLPPDCVSDVEEFIVAATSAVNSTAASMSAVDEMISKINVHDMAKLLGTSAAVIETHTRTQLQRLERAGLLRSKNVTGDHRALQTIRGQQAHIQLQPGGNLSSVTTSSRALGPERAARLQAKIQELIRDGVLEPLDASVTSMALSQAFVIPKFDENGKATGQWRLVVDLRKLNAITVPQQHPMPLATELLRAAAAGIVLTKFDLSDYFHQIELDEDSRNLVHVLANNQRYRYTRLTMGLQSAPSMAQRVAELMFGDLPNVQIYLDDITLAAAPEHALEMITRFVDRCIKHNVTVNASKSLLLQSSIPLLGHQVSHDRIAPLESRLSVLRNWPAPRSRRALQRLLGMFGFYAPFLPNYAQVAAPLHARTSTKTPFEWTAQEQKAFNELRELTLKYATKATINFDEQIILYTDASRSGTAFVFCQLDNGIEKIIELGGFSLNPHQKNYAVHELEILALQHALDRHPRLFDVPKGVEWRCDNQTAVLALDSKKPLDVGSIAIAHFIARVQGSNIRGVKIDSKLNSVADAVSRIHGDYVTVAAIISDDDDDDDDEQQSGDATPAMKSATSSPPATPPHPAIDDDKTSSLAAATPSQVIEAEAVPPATPAAQQISSTEQSESPAAAASAIVDSSSDGGGSVATPATTKEQQQQRRRDWATEQRNDATLKPYLEAARGKAVPPDIARWKPCIDPESDLLYIRDPDDSSQTCIVVPKERRTAVMRTAHEVDGSHAGQHHTEFVLRTACWWPDMMKDVRNYTQNCLQCRSHQPVKGNPVIGEIAPTAKRFKNLQMDWIPMPPGKGGLGGFYLVRDVATGWIQAYPFATLNSDNARLSLECWMADHDVPSEVHTDAGSEVTSKAMVEFAAQQGFKLSASSPANQRSNGIVERAVREAKKSLLISCRTGDVSDWPYKLNAMRRNYNRTVSTSRQASPWQLVFGGLHHWAVQSVVPQSATTSSTANSITNEPVPVVAATYAQQLGKEIERGIEAANAARHKRHEANNLYRIRRHGKVEQIVVGDYVNIENTSDAAPTAFENKQRQSGPFLVTDINAQDRRVMLRRGDGVPVGPIALSRLQRLDSAKVTEVVAPDASSGLGGWAGAADVQLLLPHERQAVAKSNAKTAAIKAAEEAAAAATKAKEEEARRRQAVIAEQEEERKREARQAAAERQAAEEQLQLKRMGLKVKQSAVPSGMMYTPGDGVLYRINQADIEGGTQDEWVYKGHTLYDKLAATYKQRANTTKKATAKRSRTRVHSPLFRKALSKPRGRR